MILGYKVSQRERIRWKRLSGQRARTMGLPLLEEEHIGTREDAWRAMQRINNLITEGEAEGFTRSEARPRIRLQEKSMKILITTDWYRPAINGVVTSVENLQTGLRRAGHDVRIVTLSGSMHSWQDGNVYYIASVNMGMVYEKARLKLRMPRNMMQDILAWNPDVVHSQCEFSTFRIAREVAYSCNAPIVHTYHTVYENYTHYFSPNRRMGKKIAEVLSRKFLSMTDAVIVPSKKMETMLLRYRVNRPIYVVPSGIDVEAYARDKQAVRNRIRSEYGIQPDETVILSIGRLAKEKNIDEILRYLKEADSKHRMMIVGDGPYRQELEKLGEELGIRERLIFTGMVSPEEVADYYSAGDIFASASRSETQGLTYMEAMASGLPLLCHADECLEGVILDGRNGYIYRTEAEFAKKLTVLLQDAERRKQMGAQAKQRMRELYSIEKFAESCLDVYNRAIAEKEYFYECRKVL